MTIFRRQARPGTADQLAWRILRWIGYMLLIIVGIPLYFLSYGGPPNDDPILVTIYWLVIAIAIVAIVVRHRRDKRRKLIARRICTACGYDLRATPLRCSECGRSVNP